MEDTKSSKNKIESLLTIYLTFLKVGAFTVGGGYAMLPVIERSVVEDKKWVNHKDFSDILIITQGMPGQLALNSAIQVGVRVRGTLGGLIAALGVTTPSVVILVIIAAWLYPIMENNEYIQAALYGVRPAVVALIAFAALKMGKSILHGWRGAVLCGVLLILAILINIHPIIIMIAGGIAGLFICREGCN